jgi:aminopeptidase N
VNVSLRIMKKHNLGTIVVFLLWICGQSNLSAQTFTKQDSLRGSNGPNRSWWNLLHYDLWLNPDIPNKRLSGKNQIKFEKIGAGYQMQIDLQVPMKIDSVIYHSIKIPAEYRDSVYYLSLEKSNALQTVDSVLIYYSGKPKEAILPPWDGGWIWKEDTEGKPFVSVACQRLGASVWFPCKDYLGDEPDQGVKMHIFAPKNLSGIGNGNMVGIDQSNSQFNIWTWEVKNPINNYSIVPYIGNYTLLNETYKGISGDLNCSYFSLVADSVKARKQFMQVALMLNCFEKWFGPYPFYEDGYKLVQAPHLGMEHQSAIAYGNGFENGYRGKDLSGTGHGLKWDFIIIHESGHEWFGNNFSVMDIADLWVHEAFTNYAETIYTECCCGKDAGTEYVVGIRQKIKKDMPIIGHYGVNSAGSTDMYYKGGNLVHLIRTLMDDDEKFRAMLIAMNQKFRHQTVSGKQIEDFLSSYSNLPLKKIFDQYLRNVSIPKLCYRKKGKKVFCWWENCIPGFSMKVKTLGGVWIEPGMDEAHPQKIVLKCREDFGVEKDFLIEVEQR